MFYVSNTTEVTLATAGYEFILATARGNVVSSLNADILEKKKYPLLEKNEG